MTNVMHSFEELVERLKRDRKKHPVRFFFKEHKNRFTQKLYKVKTWPKRAIEKHKKGYNYESLWAFDEYLAELLGNAFTEMADIAHGFPCELADLNNDENGDIAFEQWKSTLRDIAEGFKIYAKGEDLDIDVKDWKSVELVRIANVKRSLRLMQKWYPNFWD